MGECRQVLRLKLIGNKMSPHIRLEIAQLHHDLYLDKLCRNEGDREVNLIHLNYWENVIKELTCAGWGVRQLHAASAPHRVRV